MVTPTLALFSDSNLFSYILDRVKMPWTTSKENQSNDDSASETSTTKSSRWNRKPKGSVSVTAGGSESDSSSSNAAEVNSSDEGNQSHDRSTPKGYTPPKGHATPKRNDVERQRGVRKTAYKAPETPAEARKQRKELKNSMSKEEYKEQIGRAHV